jgi:hypothetical protein
LRKIRSFVKAERKVLSEIEKSPPDQPNDGFKENGRITGIIAAGLFTAAAVLVNNTNINLDVEFMGIHLQGKKKKGEKPKYRIKDDRCRRQNKK